MESRVYIDGRFYPAAEARVSVFDHGLLYGDGVFEGIRAYNGRIFKLERHVERLYASAKAIGLRVPCARRDLVGIVVDACRENRLSRLAPPGPVTAKIMAAYAELVRSTGTPIWTSQDVEPAPVKHTA